MKTGAISAILLLALSSSPGIAELRYADGTRYDGNSTSDAARNELAALIALRRISERQAAGERVTYRFGDLHFNAGNAQAFLNYVSLLKIMREDVEKNGSKLNVVEMGDLLNWDAGNYDSAQLSELEAKIRASGNGDAVAKFEQWKSILEANVEPMRKKLLAKEPTLAFREKHLESWARYAAMEVAFAKVMTDSIPGEGHNFFHLTGNHGIHYNDEIREKQSAWDAQRNRSSLFFLLKMTGEKAYQRRVESELEVGKPGSPGKVMAEQLDAAGVELRGKLRAIFEKRGIPPERIELLLARGVDKLWSDPADVALLKSGLDEVTGAKETRGLPMKAIDVIQRVAEHRHVNNADYQLREMIFHDLEHLPYLRIEAYPYDHRVEGDGQRVSQLLREAKEGVGHVVLTDRPEEVAGVSTSSGKFVTPEKLRQRDFAALKGERADAYVHLPLPQGEHVGRHRHIFFSARKVNGAYEVVLPANVFNALFHGDDHSRNATLGRHLDAAAAPEHTRAGFLVVDTGTSGSWINAQPNVYTLVKTVNGRTFFLTLNLRGEGEAPMSLLTPVQTNVGPGSTPRMGAGANGELENHERLLDRVEQSRLVVPRQPAELLPANVNCPQLF